MHAGRVYKFRKAEAGKAEGKEPHNKPAPQQQLPNGSLFPFAISTVP